MDTAGKDFFDKDFFNHNIVAVGEYPLYDIEWFTYMPENEIEKYKRYNPEFNEFAIDKLKKILNDFDIDVLNLPMKGDIKAKHHLEKIIWLIQEYCVNGWKNPVKAINFLDNGKFIVHPGTNRCAAAKFLKLKKMPVIVNFNRKQETYKKLKNFNFIENEKDLRKSLTSAGKILWRTESTENLYINGQKQDDYLRDFTFEFTHQEAWPNNGFLHDWFYTIIDFVPIKIYIDKQDCVKSLHKLSKRTLGTTFINRYTDKKYFLNYDIELIPERLRFDIPWVKITNLKKIKFNVFELLYFINPYCKTIKTQDESIVINNPKGSDDKTPIIPDCYVRP